jgi:hypothetical protein
VYHNKDISFQTKRGKEKSPSGGHCQCQKEMDGYLLATIFDREPHSDPHC